MASHPFKVKDVAAQYATDEWRVREWIRQGRLDAINISRGRRPSYRISEAALEQFERDNQSAA